jgi:hypothetical protein
MKREIEVVGRDAGGVTYRFKGGRATVYVHEKSAADLNGDLERQLEEKERQLDKDFRANADVGERVKAQPLSAPAWGPVHVGEAASGVTIIGTTSQVFVFHREIPALIADLRRHYDASFDKKKDELLARIRKADADLQAAQDELSKLKEEDGGLRASRSDP